MSIEGDTSNLRAPEERNVYSKSCYFFEAPAGRYVYRIPASQIPKAPAGRHVSYWIDT